MNFHWNILSTNLKHCCLLAHEFSLEHSFNKLETLLSYKDETNLRHFARIALKKNCCRTKMIQTCSIFSKIAVKKSKVVSPWIFIGAFFQQTSNIVVLQRNHCFVVRKWPCFLAPNPRKQPQQHFIISLCKNLVVFASILFTISSLNLPSRRSFWASFFVALYIRANLRFQDSYLFGVLAYPWQQPADQEISSLLLVLYKMDQSMAKSW